jgi:DNA-binding GntR family transcriptional regulator
MKFSGGEVSRRIGATYAGLAASLSTVRHHTAHEFVRETLRHAILNGELPGGSRLIQAKIATDLEVSTTPVREALRDLAADGLIHLVAHRGGIVRGTDMKEMQEIYDLRCLLEPYCMRLAAEQISDAELGEAEELQARMEGMDCSVGEWVELNRRFHAILIDACRSPRLMAMVNGLRDAAAIYVGLGLRSAPDHLSTSHAEHRALLDACRSRDPEAAAAALAHHLKGTVRVLSDGESASPDGSS